LEIPLRPVCGHNIVWNGHVWHCQCWLGVARGVAGDERDLPKNDIESRQDNGQNGHAASAKQMAYLRQLAAQIEGLGVHRLESLTQTICGKPLVRNKPTAYGRGCLVVLSIAIGMIDTLRAIREGTIKLAVRWRKYRYENGAAGQGCRRKTGNSLGHSAFPTDESDSGIQLTTTCKAGDSLALTDCPDNRE
jgi:hypothetical protein